MVSHEFYLNLNIANLMVNFTELRFPFSLFSAYDRDVLKRVGFVEDVMDKQLGRRVFRVTGSLSANNYIEFPNLLLSGPFLYIQMKLLTKVATIHLEVLTSSEQSIRFSLSTLYSNEEPRFLGSCLRFVHFQRLYIVLNTISVNFADCLCHAKLNG
jgi:hypothetical protein